MTAERQRTRHLARPGAKVRHVAVLTNPDDLVDAYYWAQFQEAAKRLDVKVVQTTAEDFTKSFNR